MAQTYETTGELTDDRHVTLDQPIPLAAMKVRVIVEALDTTKSDMVAFEQKLRERQRARGHVARGREEIDAYIDAERNSWDR